MELLPCEERVLGEPSPWSRHPNEEWVARCRAEIEEVRAGGERRIYVSNLSALSADDALALWNECDPKWFNGGDYDGRSVEELMIKLGIAALPGLLRYAEGKLPSALPALSIVVSPRVAPFLAELLAKGKKKARAEAWFLDHPEVACIGLVPATVEKNKNVRASAINALRFLTKSGHADVVARVAERYGVSLDATLEDDRPSRVPKIPEWLDLAKIVSPFDEARTRAIVGLLQISSPQITHSEIVRAKEQEDLRELAWSVFEQWSAAGEPVKDEWALYALGHLGDDAIVERLQPRIVRWQGRGAAQRAAKGLEVMAMIGTDLAFSHLDRLARKAPTPKLRRAAAAAVGRIAKRLGLSIDELEDRRAPDLGLDSRGRIDLGHEGWSLTLNEHLAPKILDPEGRPAKKLPSGASVEPLKRLKKDASLVAESQLARFERALVSQRIWTRDAFLRHVVGHPLLLHLARRLVWIDGRASFRVAEDGTLADVEDRPYAIEGDVRIAHPIELGPAAVLAWSKVLADYEIIQPFPQLSRSTHALAPEERTGTSLTRFVGLVVPWNRVLSVARHGFVGEGSDVVFSYGKSMAFGASLHFSIAPGIARGDPRNSGDQKIVSTQISIDLSTLGPIAQSEILRELDGLVTTAE